jgi:hypothetical protein
MITFFIVFNTAIMASKYDGINPGVEGVFENFNYLFAFIFQMEMILKLIGSAISTSTPSGMSST